MTQHVPLQSDMALADQHVLVAEDDYYLANDTARALQSAGAKIVGPFPTEAEAVRALAKTAVTAAVLDINLGAGPSFGLARALVEKRIPLLFVTGYDWDSIPPELATTIRIEKPASPTRIVSCLAAMLRRSS